MRFTGEQIAHILGQKVAFEGSVLNFTVDSRKVLPGSLFFALKGEKVDGHDFLQQAKANGACLAIVDQTYSQEIEGLPLLRVGSVMQALHTIAAWHADRLQMKVVAVTGSVGKTTTKEFLYTLLASNYLVDKTPGSQNSQIGLPLSLLSMSKAPELFIAEMGMSQPGEIQKLVSILPPDIALVTQVGLAHAQYFPGGIEEVAKAKAEILSHSRTKKAFLYTDVCKRKAFCESLQLQVVSYGSKLEGAFMNPSEEGWKISFEGKTTSSFTLPFTAKHLADNFLGAALVAKELGMSWEEIIERAQLLTPYQGRFEKIEKNGVIFINDSYNANPSSMRAALENIPKPKAGGKVIAGLGHMGELGVFSKQAHEEIGSIAAKYADILFCLGPDASYMEKEFALSGKPAHLFDSFSAFKAAVLQEALSGDVVLLKASNSLQLWKVLEEENK